MIESVHRSQDEAITAALRESNPGDVIEIHAGDCGTLRLGPNPSEAEQEAACSCAPLVVTVGPRA